VTTELEQQDESLPAPPHPRGSAALRRAGAIGSTILGLPAASVIIATIVLILVIGGLHPRFFQPGQLADVLQGSVYVGILAVGISFLIAMRDIDLSVGSESLLCTIVAALLMRGGMNPWLAALCALALGAGLGLFNALVVTYIRIPTIITTLATLSAYGGLATGVANGQQIVGLPLDNSFFTVLGGTVGGFPIAVIVVAAIAVPLAIALHRTPWGYRVLALGSNPEAAQFSGISLTRVRTQVLVLIGVLAGVSGLLVLSYFTSGDPTPNDFALEAIAAAVIGGTPLRGGSASVLGALIGAVLLNVVTAGLPYFGVPANWSEFVTGLVIIVAVGFDSLVRFQQNRAAARVAL
jgi:ribose transport system permease protein